MSAVPLSFAVIGVGNVGGALLEQLARWTGEDAPRLVGLANSRRQLFAPAGITAAEGRQALADAPTGTDLDRLVETLCGEALGRAAVLDLTASAAVAERHAGWLARGLHVVTANKIAVGGALAAWRALLHAALSGGTRYLDSTTVCAGLPVLSTLDRLRSSGDRVHRIRGLLSGTLSYLAVELDRGTPFSRALREAHALGLTEPDPRIDLSGLDVSRKLVIAARRAGIELEPEAVEVEDVLPESLRDGSAQEFLARAEVLDAQFDAWRAKARSEGGALRPLGVVDRDGCARVAWVAVPASDPLAHILPRDNCVEIVSDRYRENPLVIRGPGAGREVTAGGVLADLCSLLRT